MPRLRWTPRALADVQRLHRFLAAKDMRAARRAVAAIRSNVAILREQPRLGRRADDAESDEREWLIEFGRSGYVALYRIDDEDILILAIRHQSEAGY